MSKPPGRISPTTVWILPALALAASAIGLFALGAWFEHLGAGKDQPLAAWLTHFDAQTALGAVSNTAEVVAAVLAIAITVVAIVVELAANRYTHHITRVFVREPVNALVMGFFVLTTVYCVWTAATVGGETEGTSATRALFAMSLVTLSLLALLPYFAFVFAFLQPLHVVDRIRAHSFRVLRRSAPGFRKGTRQDVIAGLEQLVDVALNSLEHKDRTIAMASVNALFRFLQDYEELQGRFHDTWFRLDGGLPDDPDFVAMEPMVRDDIERRRIWLEMKIYRQYHTIYALALNHMRSVAYLVTMNTHRIAARAIQAGQENLLELSLRSFNTYLRAVINQKDVRTAYYTFHHYRLLAEEALELGREDVALQIARYLRFYGQLSFSQGLPFLLEVVAYDVGILCETVYSRQSEGAPQFLEVMLALDKETEHVSQERSLHGVRRAQVQLATFFLVSGDVDSARRIWDDMKHEEPTRLAAIRDELLLEESPDYWEVTDRGVNFAYLPPERRRFVLDFFDWFGPGLPPPRRGAGLGAVDLRPDHAGGLDRG